MIDRYTKIVLTVIAVCLVWNVATSMSVRPALAQMSESYLSNIAHDIHSIYSGTCNNSKLC